MGVDLELLQRPTLLADRVQVHRHRTSVDAADADAVSVSLGSTDRGFNWRIANTSSSPVLVRSVTAVCTLTDLAGRLRMFRNGWQSWSETGLATLGVDTDPATTGEPMALEAMSHHPDPAGGPAGWLRSEMLTVVADDRGAVLAGFLGGDLHDGTLWLSHGRTGQELRVQAYLGDVVLAPGEERVLHEVWLESIEDVDAAMAEWATEYGRRGAARCRSPYQLGWCSSYRYDDTVREVDVRANLSVSGDWPLQTLRVDDGYQSAVGDWLRTAESFPSGLAAVGSAIAGAGLTPGLWLAPFLVASRSVLAEEHPDWIARSADGEPLIAMYNDRWGGFVHTLDTTHPAVQEHLEITAAALSEMGFTQLKLDCAWAPGMPGRYHSASMTPAQRVRCGFDAIRRGAGDHAFLLGSGAPLGASVGVLDGMRIGPDVAPWWSPRDDLWDVPGYLGSVPAMANAWRNTLSRAFMHRRLWLNDPDCLMLPSHDTDVDIDRLTPWAMAVAVSGSMVVISDDLRALDGDSRGLLEDVLAIGRACDDAARGGASARCGDLMTSSLPRELSAAGFRLEGDPERGSAHVVRVSSDAPRE